MPVSISRCRVVPLPEHQVSMQIDGIERTRWHHGPNSTRPFFYPFIGPSGSSLTRMGHPGAPDHDHHKSIWFAHHKVLGIDFWSDTSEARVRQKNWSVLHDADDHCAIAVNLGWYDGHDPQELLEQELIAILRPRDDGETLLEIQTTFRPQAEKLEFQKTNFGFFAVRVAKNLSEVFGGGTLTSSEGLTGERLPNGQPNIFGKQARWMDYSGPVPGEAIEGITYFDHPTNPGYPSFWHVRQDGWMTASVCMQNFVETTKEKPLQLRYLLHAHRGGSDAARANQIADAFATFPKFRVTKGTKPHYQYELVAI